MVEVAREYGAVAYLVPDAARLDPEWLRSAATVGIGAGASAPESLVRGLVERLRESGWSQAGTVGAGAEDVVFSMPGRLADPVGGRIPSTPLAEESE
jgi:4-hydroxy-3-methylbut-2-enyl diphosphate reductase